MEITADNPLPSPDDNAADAAFRDVSWTPKDVLFGAFWFVGIFVGAQIAILPLAFIFGVKSGQFYTSAFVSGAMVEVGIVAVAANFTFRRYGGSWERLGVRMNCCAFAWSAPNQNRIPSMSSCGWLCWTQSSLAIR